MAQTEVFQHRLSNGLKLIGEYMPAASSCGMGFFVKSGARDESAQESGVSHFLEHMMFKGTATRSALDISYELGRIGAQANAYTSEENTVFYSAIIPEYFEAMQTLLSDMLRPALTQEDFDTEKKVILEEIALYQDRPQFYLFEHAMRAYFGSHPAGNSVLGSPQSITALTRGQMADYFARRYSPANMVLVASGHFDWQRFLAAAEQQCGSWAAPAAGRTTGRHEHREQYLELHKKNINQVHVLFIAPGASAQEDERYPLSVLSMILGDGTGSKLYWELVDKGLAEGAGAESDERDGTGCFLAYASTEPERLDQVSEIVRKVLAAPRGFSDDDLERAKTKLMTKVVLGGEVPMGRLMALGTHWNYTEQIYNLRETVERVRAVQRRDIEQVLEKYPLSSWCEYRLLPE